MFFVGEVCIFKFLKDYSGYWDSISKSIWKGRIFSYQTLFLCVMYSALDLEQCTEQKPNYLGDDL